MKTNTRLALHPMELPRNLENFRKMAHRPFFGHVDRSELPIWISVGFSGCIKGVATVAVNLRDDLSPPFQNPKLKGTVSASGSHAERIPQRFGGVGFTTNSRIGLCGAEADGIDFGRGRAYASAR